MHIMEGFLPPAHALAWGAISLPFLVASFKRIKKIIKEQPSAKLLVGVIGAFIFVLSSLKLPSVTGSCSHPTGTGLGAILFGPIAVVLPGTIALLFQALLLAHGGITTLGANIFSMAIAGPFISWGTFIVLKKMKLNESVVVFLAAALGDLFTYLITSIQLAVAFPDPSGGVMLSFLKFASIFALTQIPLAIAEGLLTVLVVKALLKYSADELPDFALLKMEAKV